jgi:hypothetical protein
VESGMEAAFVGAVISMLPSQEVESPDLLGLL